MILENSKKIFYSLANNHLFKIISKKYMNDAIIFCYHRIIPNKLIDRKNFPDQSLVTSLENFENHLKYFKKEYDCVSLSDLINNKQTSSSKFRICITFDDGYKDNIDYVLPLIKKYNIPITIYVTTRFLEDNVFLWWYELWDLLNNNDFLKFVWKNNYYNLKIYNKNKKIKTYKILSNILLNETLPNQKKLFELISGSKNTINYNYIFMNKENLQKLDNNSLVTIGLHSHSHSRFSILNEYEIRDEINSSIRILEENIHSKVLHFAYPYGQINDISEISKNIINSYGLQSIATTINKNISLDNCDQLSLPRYGISNSDNLSSIAVKINGFHSLVKEKINVSC